MPIPPAAFAMPCKGVSVWITERFCKCAGRTLLATTESTFSITPQFHN